jgi:hypothetical protein
MKKLVGVFAVGCILTLLGGVIVLFIGWEEKRLLDKGTPQPERITLAALVAKPTIDNVHLTLTDFDWGHEYVYEEKKGSWECIWFPVVPPDHEDGKQPNNPVIRVVIKSTKVRNPADADRLADLDEVTGVITNDIASMGSGAAAKLGEGYPGANFRSAIVLHEGRSFPTPEMVNLLFGSGVGLLVLGAILGVAWIVAVRQKPRYGIA